MDSTQIEDKTNLKITATNTNKSSYDISSVTIDPDLVNLLKCHFCKNIAVKPTLISCCNFISCTKCFKDILRVSPSCLNCGEVAKNIDASKVILNLFKSLTIKCKFSCGEINNLDNYEYHESHCKLNPNGLINCSKCELSFNKSQFDNHDCTKELLNNMKELKKEVKDFLGSDSQELFEKLRKSLRIHSHPLVYSKRKNAWRCNYCRTRHEGGEVSYYCYECDCDCCVECFEYTLLCENVKE